MFKKAIKVLVVLVLIALLALQFIRPEKNNSGYNSISLFETETKPTVKVSSILKNNCYDCHSNHTQYPWYAEIAPVSLWLEEHINHGKKKFNVSDWENYSLKKKDHKLEELIEMVENNEMPLSSYTLIHGKLSKDDKNLLLQWANLVKLQYKYQLEVSSN